MKFKKGKAKKAGGKGKGKGKGGKTMMADAMGKKLPAFMRASSKGAISSTRGSTGEGEMQAYVAKRAKRSRGY